MTYEDKACRYAERYGIVDYTVTGNRMLYTETFPMEGSVYDVTVNLDTETEARRERRHRR